MKNFNNRAYQISFTILLLTISTSLTYAQQYNLTESDKKEIKRRAKFRMQEFEELLQLISDPTRSRGAIDRYITSSYSNKDSLFNQVFYDEDVKIEDDITPIEFNKKNIDASALTVSAYLNNFKLQYKKYLDKTVFFTNLEFTGVQQQNFVYVVVSYDSEFRGRHTIYKSYQYKPVKRKATLRAEYSLDLDRWQVWIAGVNYDRSSINGETTSDSSIINPVDSTAAQVRVVEKEIAPEQEPQEEENIEQQEASIVNENSETSPLEFVTTLPDVVKKGNMLPLGWNQDIDDGEIKIFKGEKQMAVLRKGLYGQQWNWNVQQKPGKEYSLLLYDPATDRKAKSSSFQIKSKFPLALKIAIPVVALATAAYFLMPGEEPGTTTPDNPLIDYTIEIEPSLPGN